MVILSAGRLTSLTDMIFVETFVLSSFYCDFFLLFLSDVRGLYMFHVNTLSTHTNTSNFKLVKIAKTEENQIGDSKQVAWRFQVKQKRMKPRIWLIHWQLSTAF